MKPRPAKPRRRGRAAASRAGWSAAILVAMGLLALLLLRAGRGRDEDPNASLPVRVMYDRARTATMAHEWEQALYWGSLMANREPRNASVILGLGSACNNLAWGGARYERVRTPTRTSLDRARLELRALALMDSASGLARVEEEWDRSELSRAMTYENLGLPVDALEIYQNILRRSPAYGPARARARFVLDHLRDPLDVAAP